MHKKIGKEIKKYSEQKKEEEERKVVSTVHV